MDFLDSFGTKELYDISLKTTSNLEIGEKTFAPGETILHFDELQLSTLTDQKRITYATGGFLGANLIMWDELKAVDFICEHGVSSRNSMSILLNSKLTANDILVEVPHTDIKETNVDGELTTRYKPEKNFFIYDEDGSTPTGFLRTDQVLTGLKPFTTYTMQYIFIHREGAQAINIGSRLFNGYLTLTAKMRLKDDSDGHTTTAVLEIPKVRIMSDLSMRLGSYSSPYLSRFRIQGYPVGERDNAYVCKLIFLDTDIDS